MLRFGIALLVLGIGGTARAAGGAETGSATQVEPGESSGSSDHGSETGETSTDETSKAAAPAKKSASSKASKSRRSKTRYKFVSGVVPEEKLRAGLPPPPSGNIHLYNPSTEESLKVNVFNPDGSYSVDALKQVSHFLRCKRTNTEREMEPRLLAILSHVYDHFGEKRIEVVSAYRNQRKQSSYHYKGSATDIRLTGVTPQKLRAFVETLDAGGMGIGLYPRTGFVHIDVRPPPSFRWIDYSPSDPDNPDKKPPRGFKKKRLQS